MWGSQRAWQHFGTTHITCSMLIHMSGDIKFSVLCTLLLEEFDLIVLIKREMAALAKSWSQRWSLDFSPFDSFDSRLSFRHSGWLHFSLVQENIILEERMSFFVQWLEIIGNEWSRFLKNRFYIQENSKTLKQCTFSLFSWSRRYLGCLSQCMEQELLCQKRFLFLIGTGFVGNLPTYFIHELSPYFTQMNICPKIWTV